MQSERAEAGDVGGCGEEVEVGVDFGLAAHAGVAPAVFSAHEVRQFAFDFGARGAVVVAPALGLLALSGRGEHGFVSADAYGSAGFGFGAVAAQFAVGAGVAEAGGVVILRSCPLWGH